MLLLRVPLGKIFKVYLNLILRKVKKLVVIEGLHRHASKCADRYENDSGPDDFVGC